MEVLLKMPPKSSYPCGTVSNIKLEKYIGE
jgi:hypothetical protein